MLGPEENLRSFTREGIVAFRERRWAGCRGGAFLAGNLDHLPEEQELQERFARFPALPDPEPYVPARRVPRRRSSSSSATPTSRTCG